MTITQKIINYLAGYDISEKVEQLHHAIKEKDTTIHQLKETYKGIEEKYQSLYTRQNEISNEITKYKEENIRLESEKKLQSSQICNLKNELQNYEEIISEEKNKNNETLEKLTDTINKCNKLEINIDEYKSYNNKLQSFISQSNEDIARLKNEISSLTESISAKENEINDLSRKNNELSEAYCGLQNQLQTVSYEMQDLKNENETLESNCEKHLERNNLIDNENKKLQEQLNELNLKYNNLNSLYNELYSKHEESIKQSHSDEEIRNLEKQIQTNEEAIASLNQTLSIKEDELRRIKDEKKHLEKALEDERVQIISQSTKISKYNNLNNILYEENKQLKNRIDSLENRLKNDNIPSKEESNKQESLSLDSQVNLESSQKEADKSNSIEEKPAKTPIPKSYRPVKNKEQEAFQLSDGNIVDFPEITNDTDDTTSRSIRYVYNDKGKIIDADNFFRMSSAEEIAHVSRMLSEADIKSSKYWTCGICRARVKIAHRRYGNNKESLFFMHAQKNVNCPWTIMSDKSNDNHYEGIDIEELTEEEIKTALSSDTNVLRRDLKLKIISLLNSEKSKALGVTDVNMDKIIRSNFPYMKWRRPDISFNFKDRKVVIELQNNNVDLDTIVDKDIFYRINNVQVIWVFGNGNESKYDYMKLFNYKNTLFANHRNVFVLDKEALEESISRDELLLKCNWLDEDNKWKFTLENSNTNGKLIILEELTFDDEFCKPYYFNANEAYFTKHPEAYTEYMGTLISREGLKKSIEDKWVNSNLYQDALTEMRKTGKYAEISKYGDLWGFRFNNKSLINPIFTSEPKLQDNRFYKVALNNKLGIVDKYGMKIIDWDNDFDYDDIYYDDINNCIIFTKDSKMGVADKLGNEIVPATYESIEPWDKGIFKVQKGNRYGLIDLNNNIITDIKYNKIGKLESGSAKVTITHPTQSWRQLENYIDKKGKLISKYSDLNDEYCLVQEFGLLGVCDKLRNTKIPCLYDEIQLWVDDLVRVKSNGKWGVINISDNSIRIPIKYDSIGNFIHGVANVTFVGTKSCINIRGEEVVEKSIELQNSLAKTLKSGKWGIEDNNGNEIVAHMYDEIGSFRRRLIGIINNRVVKLDAYYDYPIPMIGRLMNEENNKYMINIAGVSSYISIRQLKNMNLNRTDIFNNNDICDKLGFMNIDFINERYELRYISESNKSKLLSFGDKNSNFTLGEIIEGKISNIKKTKKKSGEYRIVSVLVKFPDSRVTVVKANNFNTSNKNINDYNINDSIRLKKLGFDDNIDRTIWQVL
ncbi:WG repeat-containing protein [uncultured Bacteroides sp.]|uniref:DUF6035 family protein n=1 Tax=uncultured Bacteroides sp. TaxID=162156 RepID=UPI00262C4818|nr:WG repeat-containing protein [uncultured Bacteroides sp.]